MLFDLDGPPEHFNRADRRAQVGFYFNRSMLTTAREARSLTQAELASRLGVGQALIGKWESGISHPNDDQVKKLAAALGFGTKFFFVDRPRRDATMSDFYHRALARAKRSDVRTVHARCNIFDLQVDRLLQGEDLQDDRIPSIDPMRHNGDMEKVAAEVREKMEIGPGPVSNVVGVIEKCGGIIIDHDLEVDDVDALCRWVPELPKLFFVNNAKPADRIRFSLGHELGHTVMHFNRECRIDIAEEQANKFSLAFLIPAHELRRDIRGSLSITDLASLKRKWRVSMQAITRRALQVGSIDENRYKSLNVQISRQGWKKDEPVKIDGETPRAFVNLIRKRRESGYSVEDLATLLFVSTDDVERLLKDSEAPTAEDHGVRLRLTR